MNISGVPGFLLGIFEVVLILVALVAAARATWSKAQIEALRDDRDDRDKRIEFLEKEDERKTKELQHLEQKVADLQELVVGRKKMDEIHSVGLANQQILKRIAEKVGAR